MVCQRDSKHSHTRGPQGHARHTRSAIPVEHTRSGPSQPAAISTQASWHRFNGSPVRITFSSLDSTRDSNRRSQQTRSWFTEPEATWPFMDSTDGKAGARMRKAKQPWASSGRTIHVPVFALGQSPVMCPGFAIRATCCWAANRLASSSGNPADASSGGVWITESFFAARDPTGNRQRFPTAGVCQASATKRSHDHLLLRTRQDPFNVSLPLLSSTSQAKRRCCSVNIFLRSFQAWTPATVSSNVAEPSRFLTQ